MQTRLIPDSYRTATLDTQALRNAFLLENLFEAGQVNCCWVDSDRAIAGAAVPSAEAIGLPCDEAMRSQFFLERREMGVLNIGGPGQIAADGRTWAVETGDCLYLGAGTRDVRFSSHSKTAPARYYFVSYPAHREYPSALARRQDAVAAELGSQASCNHRTIYKYIHPAGIKSCQLVMGYTELKAGNVWNTMPPHTHLRRSEIYLYFNIPAEARVAHFMGRPEQTRHLFVANEQAVISPAWSIHSGVGTAAYSFCWAMGGENQAFDDMDAAPLADLR